jgi:hypothetical protein
MLAFCAFLAHLWLPLHARFLTLDHVRQLVRQQVIACLGPRRKLTGAEVDVFPDGERLCAHAFGRLR